MIFHEPEIRLCWDQSLNNCYSEVTFIDPDMCQNPLINLSTNGAPWVQK